MLAIYFRLNLIDYSKQILHNSVNDHIFSNLDTTKCCSDFNIFGPNILHILCAYHSTKRFVQGPFMGAFALGIVLFGFYAHKYFYCESSVL